MELGEATAIFQNIYNSEISVNEKKTAIKIVLKSETHNGITKQEILNALNWLVEYTAVYDANKVLEKLKRRSVFLINYKELLYKNRDCKSINKISAQIKEVESIIEIIKAEILR